LLLTIDEIDRYVSNLEDQGRFKDSSVEKSDQKIETMKALINDLDKLMLKNLSDELNKRKLSESTVLNKDVDLNPNLVLKRLQEVLRIKKVLEEETAHEKELNEIHNDHIEKIKGHNEELEEKLKEMEELRGIASKALTNVDELSNKNKYLFENKDNLESIVKDTQDKLEKQKNIYDKLLITHFITKFELDRQFVKQHGDTNKYHAL